MLSKKLTIEFFTGDHKLLEAAENVCIASALVSNWALSFITSKLINAKSIKLLLGINLPSDISALEKILELQDQGILECRLYTKGFFHPKLYLFEGEGFTRLYVGSGNFTKGGLLDNVELFHREDNSNSHSTYMQWFEEYFQKSTVLNQDHIDKLRAHFEKQKRFENEVNDDFKKLSDIIAGNYNLDRIDFENQFFNKNNHITFSPENKSLENEHIYRLRKDVRFKLYELHDKLYPEIKKKRFDLHPHYVHDDIVSKVETTFHRSNEIAALWLHYGRKKGEIKRYGDNETPVAFPRLQLIIHYDDIGIWLRFGKDNGSMADREYFHKHMESSSYREEIFRLLMLLGDNYWILIGEERKYITEFERSDEFWEFSKRDNWRTDYFIIGYSIHPGDKMLSNSNIVATVLNGFEKLYPLYVAMKDKSFL
ncbi:MAG: phospholipase D family protein [Oceanicaulis sp.]|nr:phospholipase D family protein [Oceanicaulis sp.]